MKEIWEVLVVVCRLMTQDLALGSHSDLFLLRQRPIWVRHTSSHRVPTAFTLGARG